MEVVRINMANINILNLIVVNFLKEESDIKSLDYSENLLKDDRTYLYAVLEDNDVIGYALGYLGYLYDIEVAEEHRKKGAGRMLMEKVKKDLKEDDVVELWLGTAVDNAGGQALFSKTGGIKSDETFNDFTFDLE
jgi:ribosomal protein S18 acetylase RimI-like enzyme